MWVAGVVPKSAAEDVRPVGRAQELVRDDGLEAPVSEDLGVPTA